MSGRRQFLALAGAVAFGGCAELGGGNTTSAPTTGGFESGKLVFSTVFADGGTIPAKYTADGADVSPPLKIESVTDEARTLGLVVDDPDAPGGTFVHWLLWNVPASTTKIPEGLPQRKRLQQLDGARQGTNGFGELGYRGPKPPKGDGPHTYRFTMHAVDSSLDVPAGAKRGPLQSALAEHSIVTSRITAEYDRS